MAGSQSANARVPFDIAYFSLGFFRRKRPISNIPMQIPQPEYRVWALDDVIYGPVPLESLRSWVRDERIHQGSWIFCEKNHRWQTAGDLPGLRELFEVADTPQSLAGADEVRPAMLRRIRVLSELTDSQLAIVAQHGEQVRFNAYTTIMKMGAPGDSLFLVLEGHVRQRIFVKEREILIGIQEAGGQFGQISLFDRGPRITDAISDTPVTLFKIDGDRFRALCHAYPEIATPILLSLGRTLATRIRTDDKHLCEIVAMNA